MKKAKNWRLDGGVSKSKAIHRMILSLAARRDIRDILVWSLDKFGEALAKRYRSLIIQALRDLEIDPMRPGSRTRPDLAADARTYHLALSRIQIEGTPVKTPRHFILYRLSSKGVEVARILHDSRDLARHLPEDYRP